MTVDEELNLLDESVRRLKIEYDVYFGGGSKRPPADTDWRVQTLIKKYCDGHKMSFGRAYRLWKVARLQVPRKRPPNGPRKAWQSRSTAASALRA